MHCAVNIVFVITVVLSMTESCNSTSSCITILILRVQRRDLVFVFCFNSHSRVRVHTHTHARTHTIECDWCLRIGACSSVNQSAFYEYDRFMLVRNNTCLPLLLPFFFVADFGCGWNPSVGSILLDDSASRNDRAGLVAGVARFASDVLAPLSSDVATLVVVVVVAPGTVASWSLPSIKCSVATTSLVETVVVAAESAVAGADPGMLGVKVRADTDMAFGCGKSLSTNDTIVLCDWRSFCVSKACLRLRSSARLRMLGSKAARAALGTRGLKSICLPENPSATATT
jgi:hypothetical protein